jgi:O-antigen/teichoic acid export membrane protein
MTSRARRIARNTVFNVGTGMVQAAALFVSGVLVARFLGPVDTGLYALVNFAVVIVVTLGASGLNFAGAKFVGQHDVEETHGEVRSIAAFVVRAGLVTALVLAGVLAALSGVLADLFDQPRSASLFVLGALVSVPMTLTRVVAGPLQGLQRQAVFLPLALVQGVLLVGGTLAVLMLGGGLTELLLVQLGMSVVVLALHLLALRSGRPERSPARLGAMRRRMLSYGAAVTGMAAVDLVVWQRSEIVLLGAFRDPDEVAFYSIAFAMAEALQQTVPAALSLALFPALSRAFASGDRLFMSSAYRQSIRVTALVTLPVAVAGALLARAAIETVYGAEFLDAAIALQILLFSAAAGRIGFSFSSVLYAADRERLMLALSSGWMVLNVALGLVLIPAHGVVGAAVANASVQLAAIALAPFIIARLFGLGFPTSALLRAIAACVPLALAVGAVVLMVDSPGTTLVVGAIAAVPAYVAGLLVSGALTDDERAIVGARARRLAGRA